MDNCGTSDPFRFTLDTASETMSPGQPSSTAESLIHQTRLELNRFVHEITALCRSRIEPSQFWNPFLSKLLAATAAQGAVLWQRERDSWLPKFTSGTIDSRLLVSGCPSDAKSTAHDRLIVEVADTSGPVVVPPGSQWASEQPGNPTDFPAALIPLELDADQPTEILLEVFLPGGGGPSTQRGYLRFLTQMTELAVGYLRRTRFDQVQRREAELLSLKRLTEALQSSCSWPDFANILVNRLADHFQADRVSLVYQRPGRSRRDHADEAVVSISHCLLIDPKSSVVAELLGIASSAHGSIGMHWSSERNQIPAQDHWDGSQEHRDANSDDEASQLPGNMFETTVPTEGGNSSLGELYVRGVVVIDHEACWKLVIEDASPVNRSEVEDFRWECFVSQLGLLIEASPALRARADLSRLQETLRCLRTKGGRFAIPMATVVILAVAACIPVPLAVTAKGHLEPRDIQEVFAPRNAVVEQVLVSDGQRVEVGQPLVVLSDPELSHALQTARGRRIVLESRISELQQKLIDTRPSESDQVFRIQTELVSMREEHQAVGDELQLLEQQEKGLTLLSQSDGVVDAWNLQESSFQRPVSRGESLLRIFDDAGDWEVIAGIPEVRLPHLGTQEQTLGRSVKIVLSSSPQIPLQGTIAHLGSVVHYSDSMNQSEDFVATKIRVTSDQLPIRQVGAPATVSISCGLAPLGYVVGEDLLRMVRTTFALYR